MLDKPPQQTFIQNDGSQMSLPLNSLIYLHYPMIALINNIKIFRKSRIIDETILIAF